MTVAFAFVSWRSFAERERYIAHLRPFAASQHLYEQLLTAGGSLGMDAGRPVSYRICVTDAPKTVVACTNGI
jgi:hypothetical protein